MTTEVEGVTVIIRPLAFTCSLDGKRVTAVLVPIKVEREGDRLLIRWGCSRAKSCSDRTCIYSRGFTTEEVEEMVYAET